LKGRGCAGTGTRTAGEEGIEGGNEGGLNGREE
jgi:hypothetical protein